MDTVSKRKGTDHPGLARLEGKHQAPCKSLFTKGLSLTVRLGLTLAEVAFPTISA